MNRVTSYWDADGRAAWYKNELGIWRTGGLMWLDSVNQHWNPQNFQKSLTVNNFKEK